MSVCDTSIGHPLDELVFAPLHNILEDVLFTGLWREEKNSISLLLNLAKAERHWCKLKGHIGIWKYHTKNESM